jgi:hypothetical protein
MKRRAWSKTGIGVVVILFVATMGFLVTYSKFVVDACRNSVVSEIPSPSGRVKLVVFQRDCGATTGFSTQASLLKQGEQLGSEPGNVVVADTNHGFAPSGPGGGPQIGATWESDSALILELHPAARTFRAEHLVTGVAVTYKEASAQ